MYLRCMSIDKNSRTKEDFDSIKRRLSQKLARRETWTLLAVGKLLSLNLISQLFFSTYELV